MNKFPEVPGKRPFRGLELQTEQTETILARDEEDAREQMEFRHGPQYMGGQKRWELVPVINEMEKPK